MGIAIPARHYDLAALADGVLYQHHSDVSLPAWPWRHFLPAEIACSHCGELYVHPRTLDAAERARKLIGQPLPVNSGHRCRIKNAMTPGAAPRSPHLLLALDFSTRSLSAVALFHALIEAGFQSFGGYLTFIHADMRPGRFWYGGPDSKKVWSRHFARTLT